MDKFNQLKKLLRNNKIINNKHGYILYLCLFVFSTSNAQTFDSVGCIPPYETISLGEYNNELLYSREWG